MWKQGLRLTSFHCGSLFITKGQFCLCQLRSNSSHIHCHNRFVHHQKASLSSANPGRTFLPSEFMLSCRLGSFYASQYCLEELSVSRQCLDAQKEKKIRFGPYVGGQKPDPQTSHKRKCVISRFSCINSKHWVREIREGRHYFDLEQLGMAQ